MDIKKLDALSDAMILMQYEEIMGDKKRYKAAVSAAREEAKELDERSKKYAKVGKK